VLHGARRSDRLRGLYEALSPRKQGNQIEQMREIESLLTEAAKIANELKRLDQMEEEARAAIVDATDSDVTLPSTQQKIGEARLSLQVVPRAVRR